MKVISPGRFMWTTVNVNGSEVLGFIAKIIRKYYQYSGGSYKVCMSITRLVIHLENYV